MLKALVLDDCQRWRPLRQYPAALLKSLTTWSAVSFLTPPICSACCKVICKCKYEDMSDLCRLFDSVEIKEETLLEEFKQLTIETVDDFRLKIEGKIIQYMCLLNVTF